MAGLSTCLVLPKFHANHVISLDKYVLNRSPFCPKKVGNLQRFPSIRSQATRRHHRRRGDDLQGFNMFTRKQDRKKDERMRDQDSAEERVVFTIDMEEIKERLRRVGYYTKKIVQENAQKAMNAGHGIAEDSVQLLRDLRSSIAVQNNTRVVVAVRKSSLVFGVRALFWALFVIVFGKLLLSAAKRFRWGWSEGGWSRLYKSVVRDRSLGGREVTLRTGSPLDGVVLSRSEKDMIKRRSPVKQVKQDVQLPAWWPGPDSLPLVPPGARRNQAQVQARALVQEMIQKRIGGQDFMEDDIIELRRLCRDSGAKVSFDTANTRDAFYRIAINYVISVTSRLGTGLSSLELGNEGSTKFIAGLAGHIGLDVKRAATMVDAAVAARTKGGFLQAWALFKQKSIEECEEELLKLIRVHSCFRPEPNSPEIELVARGLTAYLPEEQRKRLLEMYVACGGSDTILVAEEALGLVSAYR